MCDARKSLTIGKLRQDFRADRELHATCDVVNRHFVRETDVLSKVQVINCNPETTLRACDQYRRQVTIGVCVGNTSAMDEHDSHGRFSETLYTRRQNDLNRNRKNLCPDVNKPQPHNLRLNRAITREFRAVAGETAGL